MSSPARPSRVVVKLPRRRGPRRTCLGRGRRLVAGRAGRQGSFSAERLEPRLLLAAENLLAPDIAAYPNQLQPFAEPAVISSRDGVLEASVRLVSAQYPRAAAFGRVASAIDAERRRGGLVVGMRVGINSSD